MEATAGITPRPMRRAGSRRGSELIEFTFAFLPLTAMLVLMLDASWAIYVKSTLAYAVHEGVRQGITIDSTQANGATLTSLVQTIVQQKALGLLAGPTNLAKIHVDYYRVSSTNSSQLVTVTQAGGGIMAGDIIQVSIQGYSLPALAPRIYSWKSAPDNSPTSIAAIAADRIEPFSSLPSI
jgi:Flp pilus assembly protein TadG